MFALHPSIEAASAVLAELPLCLARLHNDMRFPWLVLVPRRAGLGGIDDLAPAEFAALTPEILAAGQAVRAIGQALGRPVERLNLGALGNITPQLHIHVVGRRADDDAWPGPVWSHGLAVPYGERALACALAAARSSLASG